MAVVNRHSECIGRKPTHRFGACICMLLSLWILVLGDIRAGAESSAPSRQQVQAAFLFNFAKFVTWPDEAFKQSRDMLIIGVIGEDPFGAILEETVHDKTIQGRKLAVRRFTKIEDATNSHILFLGSSEESHLSSIMKALEKTNTLTVSDIDQFAELGGMVAFTLEDQRVRFNVNMEAVERADLKMGSQLLKLARIVSEKTQKGK